MGLLNLPLFDFVFEGHPERSEGPLLGSGLHCGPEVTWPKPSTET